MSEFLCVDANIGAKWVLEEEDSPSALRLYLDCLSAGTTLIAPPHFAIEVTNAIRRRVARGQILPVEGDSLLRAFLAFRVAFPAADELYERALQIADQYNRPTAYDAHYVALAEIYGCDFWTADQRLLNALDGRLPFVRALRDYVAEDDDATAP